MFWQGGDGLALLLLDLFHGEGTSVCHLPVGLQVFWL